MYSLVLRSWALRRRWIIRTLRVALCTCTALLHSAFECRICVWHSHVALALRFCRSCLLSRLHVTPALRICMLLLHCAFARRYCASHLRVTLPRRRACVSSSLRFVALTRSRRAHVERCMSHMPRAIAHHVCSVRSHVASAYCALASRSRASYVARSHTPSLAACHGVCDLRSVR